MANAPKALQEKSGDRDWDIYTGIIKRFPVPRRVFFEFVEKGYIRTLKFSPARQARRLYSISDMSEVMDALSVGKKPEVKTQ